MKSLFIFLAAILLTSAIVGNASAWKFAAVGDIECKSASKVGQALAGYELVLLLGDLGYSKSSKCIKDAIPQGIPTVGNHDKLKDIVKVFKVPKNGIFGTEVNGVGFISLNSEKKVTDQDGASGKLVNQYKDLEWIIAFSHYPCVTNPSAHHGEWKNCKKTLVPILDQFQNLGLYINGHNHGYQKCNYNGIDFVTSGAGGRDPYSWGSKIDDNCKNNISGKNGYLDVEVDGNSLTGVFKDLNGQAIEDTTFQVTK